MRNEQRFKDVSGGEHIGKHFHGSAGMGFFNDPMVSAKKILSSQKREDLPEVSLEQGSRLANKGLG
jgi:hypothetical protein